MIWVDAQISPAVAKWLGEDFGHPASSLRALGLKQAEDREIFLAARAADAIVMTKDEDFQVLLDELGPPPAVIWLTCGNTSTEALRRILATRLTEALALIAAGESLVEISGPS